LSENGSTLQSVTNALRLLEAFDGSQPELGVAELSRMLNLGKSTVFRLISTLEARGYLVQNPVTGKYRLGLTLLRLGGLVLSQKSLVRDSQPFLEEISRRTGEAALLSMLDRGYAFFINKVESPHAVRMGATVGAHLPAYCSGTGKAMLAHLPADELERYLKETEFVRHTPNTIIDPEVLRAHLAEVRRQGVAIDREEFEEGLCSIAAPVRDRQGRVFAAISAAGPLVRLQKREEEIKQLLTSMATDLSRSLGYTPA